MGTHHKGKPDEVRALDCYIKLMRAADSVSAQVNRQIAKAKLTPSQFGTLEALYHLGPLHSGQLSQKLWKSAGNLTTVLDNLERRGLISRQRVENDRRAVMIHLTEQGRRLIERMFPDHARFITGLLSSLSADEQERLAALSRKLGRSAAALSPPDSRNRSST
jgi:MarR family 2-MHQ and catechol resistance regulon transcriptional repressor